MQLYRSKVDNQSKIFLKNPKYEALREKLKNILLNQNSRFLNKISEKKTSKFKIKYTVKNIQLSPLKLIYHPATP